MARQRADITVIPANAAHPTDSGLLAKAVGKMARAVRRVQEAGGATRTGVRDRRRTAARRVREIASTHGRHPVQNQDPGHPPRHRACPRVPQARQMAKRLRRSDQLPQAPIRLGPHSPGRPRGSLHLVWPRGIRPQRGQDQPATACRRNPARTQPSDFSGRSNLIGGSARGYQPGLRVVDLLAAAVTGHLGSSDEPPTDRICTHGHFRSDCPNLPRGQRHPWMRWRWRPGPSCTPHGARHP
jgi:hypothetical protein